MSVSAVSHTSHPSASKPSEVAEVPGTDHDGDGDESTGAVRPTPGQSAPGGGIYL